MIIAGSALETSTQQYGSFRHRCTRGKNVSQDMEFWGRVKCYGALSAPSLYNWIFIKTSSYAYHYNRYKDLQRSFQTLQSSLLIHRLRRQWWSVHHVHRTDTIQRARQQEKQTRGPSLQYMYETTTQTSAHRTTNNNNKKRDSISRENKRRSTTNESKP